MSDFAVKTFPGKGLRIFRFADHVTQEVDTRISRVAEFGGRPADRLVAIVEHALAHRDVRDWYVFEAASWALAARRMALPRRRGGRV